VWGQTLQWAKATLTIPCKNRRLYIRATGLRSDHRKGSSNPSVQNLSEPPSFQKLQTTMHVSDFLLSLLSPLSLFYSSPLLLLWPGDAQNTSLILGRATHHQPAKLHTSWKYLSYICFLSQLFIPTAKKSKCCLRYVMVPYTSLSEVVVGRLIADPASFFCLNLNTYSSI
jgi:hypothetical protein